MITVPRFLHLAGYWFALLLGLGALATAQTSTSTYTYATSTGPTATGDSTVRGRAIYDDNEKPVRRAPVSLISNRNEISRTTVTDINGEFTFKKVVAGEYRVVVQFPGYTNGFGFDFEGLPATTLSVDGTSSQDVKLRAIRGAAITGKIMYPDGEPAVGAQVNVFVKLGKHWQHAQLVAHGTETDDRGIFRIYPLRAGEYVLSVIEQSMVIEERDGGMMQTVGNMSVTPYYYADASTFKNAKVILVEAGRETSNINFTLAERATYEVSGTLTSNEKPVSGAYLRLQTAEDRISGPTLDRPYGLSTRSDKDGHWSFTSVPDGQYEVVPDPTGFFGRNSSPKRYIDEPKPVTVTGADVPDVAIALTEAGKISGTIVVEGDKPLPDQIGLTSELVGADGQRGYGSSSSADLSVKGTWVLDGVHPGETRLMIGAGKNHYVKSITWGSRDLLRQTVKVEAGREIQGVRVVLSTEVGSLTGRIVSAEGKRPLARMAFMLAPTDTSRWNFRDGFISGYSDDSGKFNVQGAPGEYSIFVLADVRALRSVDDLKKMVPEAQHVTLKTTPQNEVEISAP